jgi:hypothetical protein
MNTSGFELFWSVNSYAGSIQLEKEVATALRWCCNKNFSAVTLPQQGTDRETP